MKAFAITLFISALFISSISCDSCSEAYNYADASVSSLRNHFVHDQYMEMSEDFENVLRSAEMIQQSCSENFVIQSTQSYTCSLAFVMLSELLDTGFERGTSMVNILGQIVSLIPTIEGKLCLDAWEITSLQNQDMDDDIWSDHDASDDYSYDRSDNYDDDFLVEDEEEEDTGDEIYNDTDGDDIYEDWTDNDDDDDDDRVEFTSDIPTDYDDEDEDEEEGDLEIDEIEDVTVIQEIPNEEETIMVFVDLTKQADLYVQVEEEALVSEEIPATTQEDQDMIMVFVDMTNMANVENSEFAFEGEEEDIFSIYAEISGENGEYSAELYNEDGSRFIYAEVDTSAGVDDVVNAIFAADQDDIEDDVSELDLQQYWDDDEDDDYY